MSETVKCPMHGNEIELIEKGKKLVAVCNCFTGPVKNRWKGKIVFSKDMPKVKKSKPKAKPEAEKKDNKEVNNG